MVIPQHLQMLITFSQEQILTNEALFFQPVQRLKIYKEISSTYPNAKSIFSWLSIQTINFVLPIVASLPLEDYQIENLREMSEFAKSILLRTTDNDEAQYTLYNLYYHTCGHIWLYNDVEYPLVAKYVNASLYDALLITSGELPFGRLDGLNVTELTQDADFYPRKRGDVASAAVLAYANKDYLIDPENKVVAENRLTFWEWWLHEAIPQAWELANLHK